MNSIMMTLKSIESNSKLFFTDADSLIYEIKTDDVYEDFSSDKEMICFSNYFSYY